MFNSLGTMFENTDTSAKIFKVKKEDKELQILIKTRFSDFIEIIDNNFKKIEDFISEEIEKNPSDIPEANELKKLSLQSQKIWFLLYILNNEITLTPEVMRKNYMRYKAYLRHLYSHTTKTHISKIER